MNATSITADNSAANPGALYTPYVRTLLDLWFTFHIVGGHFLIPVLLATFLFSQAKRDAALINLGLTFSLMSVFNCLLLYANQYVGPEPNKTLCIFQAAAFDAGPPMWGAAIFALVVQVWTKVEAVFGKERKPLRWLIIMLAAPYVAFLGFFVLTYVLGSQHPDAVTRERRMLYCSIESRVASLTSIGFTAIVSFSAIGLAARMCFRMYQFLRLVRRTQRQVNAVRLVLRLVAFMTYLFIALSASLWSIRDHSDTFVRDIYVSTLSISYFLIFATQSDVVDAWCFWRGRRARRAADAGAKVDTPPRPSGALLRPGDLESIPGSAAPSAPSSPVRADARFQV
ncbi:hypothetical protein BC834DRAFT_845160 [Gloeopeniophorella convolvens]|nr:hypothetical protein BC834DRAFT_845160 [Gloeopeniophorella convolvens]